MNSNTAPEFDNWSKNYEEYIETSHMYYLKVKFDHLSMVIKEKFKKNKIKILDIGCGRFDSWKYIKGRYSQIWGIDESEKMFSDIEAPYPLAVRSMKGDILDIPKKDGVFDLTFSFCIFHHLDVKNIQKAISEMKRVTSQGGLVIIGEHNPINPITRFMVRRCILDKEAVLWKPSILIEKATELGLKYCGVRYCIFFPEFLSFLSPLEKLIHNLPLGGQYMLIFENTESIQRH